MKMKEHLIKFFDEVFNDEDYEYWEYHDHEEFRILLLDWYKITEHTLTNTNLIVYILCSLGSLNLKEQFELFNRVDVIDDEVIQQLKINIDYIKSHAEEDDELLIKFEDEDKFLIYFKQHFKELRTTTFDKFIDKYLIDIAIEDAYQKEKFKTKQHKI